MRGNVVLWFAVLLFACGCGTDFQEIADSRVDNDLLVNHEKREAIPFLEGEGHFYDLDGSTKIDGEIVLPLLKRLAEIAPTEQWMILRPKTTDSAFALLIELPGVASIEDAMAAAVQEADDKFPGFILQQWGREWLLMDLIDEDAYAFLKQADPEIDKQR